MPIHTGDFRPSDSQVGEMAAPPPPPGGLDPAEAAVINAAADADEARMQAFEGAAPEGEYSVQSLNLLVGSLNEVLPLFGEDQPYPTFAEDIDGPLPTEFVANLMMVNDAAGQAGLARMAFDVSTAGDDSGLEAVAGKLSALADSDPFKTFLNTNPLGGPAAEEAEEAPPVEPGLEPAVTGDEFDNLALGRI